MRGPLILPLWQQRTFAILNGVLPGTGLLLLGWRNPHLGLRRRGLLQLGLLVLGSYPLVLGGVIAYAWAIPWAVRVWRAERGPLPPRPLKST